MAIATILLGSGGAAAQIADQIVLYKLDSTAGYQIGRYDRKLNLLGLTPVQGVGAGDGTLSDIERMGVDGQGRYWVPFDALNDTKVLRMEPNGTLILPSVNLQHNPNDLVTTPWETTYVLTRIPLLAPAPLYAVTSDGTVSWSNPAGPSLFLFYPQQMCVTPTGEIWIGGQGQGSVPGTSLPLLVQVDPADGTVVQHKLYELPAVNVVLGGPYCAPDGSFWATFSTYVTHLVDLEVVQQAKLPGATLQFFQLDVAGNLLTAGNGAQSYQQTLLRFDASTLTLTNEYPIGGFIRNIALGPTGEDVYLCTNAGVSPYLKRLHRLNFVTGTKSSVSLDPSGIDWDIPLGDPTGFLWANVKDQQGDADLDGAANRAETLAGSNPFDASSRPEGPKVYVSFAPTTNAIVLTYKDPDGLLDPQGGLDLGTLSLTIANYGNVFWFLLPFATALDLSPDMKEATLTFGALPLPLDKKWRVEATVADLTGATAWDWQVTPPGDL